MHGQEWGCGCVTVVDVSRVAPEVRGQRSEVVPNRREKEGSAVNSINSVNRE